MVVCLFACLISYLSVMCMSRTIYIDAGVISSSSSSALQGFPNEPAADIALNTVKRWIKENPDKVGQVWVMQIQIRLTRSKCLCVSGLCIPFE